MQKPILPQDRNAPPWVRILCVATVTAYVAGLLSAYLSQTWLFDDHGRPIASDFISFWSAGKLALEGRGVEAYDWTQLHQIQALGAGYDFPGRYHWPYPPHLLLIYAPLALVPFPWGHLVWMTLTLPLYLLAMRLTLPRSGVLVAALAFPAAFWNFGIGQNGFFAAGIFGCALVALDRRPALAGVLIALLTYKPQFGIFIPLALLAEGRWRTIGAAAVTTLALAAVAAAVFGVDAWVAFFRSMGESNRVILIEGGADYAELLSAFGVVRWLGGGLTVAWAAQGALIILLAISVWRVWRSGAPSDVKRALLVSASIMGSPYCFIYDLAPLALAIAFLFRSGCSERERAAIGVACLLVLGGPIASAPVAAFAAPIMAAIALIRFASARDAHPAAEPAAAA